MIETPENFVPSGKPPVRFLGWLVRIPLVLGRGLHKRMDLNYRLLSGMSDSKFHDVTDAKRKPDHTPGCPDPDDCDESCWL